MKKLLLLITLCSLPFIFAGCAKKIEDVTITIYGTAVDNDTQAPIDGVLVTLIPGTKSVKTGRDGYFEFPDIETQQYTLTAQKPNYTTDRRYVNANAGERVEVTFIMHKEK
jgi:hypothetical protein